jgi:hypothetical protein
VLTIRRSKTDPFGRGQDVGILHGRRSETCPIVALRLWLAALHDAGFTEGALFRRVTSRSAIEPTRMTGDAVAIAVKRLVAEYLDCDPTAFAAHSLRRGSATEAAKAGAPLRALLALGRWRSERVAMGYIEAASTLGDDAPGRYLPL